MDTRPITPERLASSVIAVPPLARNGDFSLNADENTKLIRYIESGGVNILLYGGNANLYHISLSEYEGILDLLGDAAGEDTLIIPSVGPAYGTMMEQAAFLKKTDFPTVMVLPQMGVTTPEGVEAGIRRFAKAFGKPVVVYIKHDGYLEPENVKRLVDEGLVSFIKYATVRDNAAEDPYLLRLIDIVDPSLIVSGIGEQPAIVHLRDFGLNGFTAGCVCVRPDLSESMRKAMKAGDWEAADSIRQTFAPLEDLRNAINPITVLHEAVALAGIAEMGPLLPLLSNIGEDLREPVGEAARELLNA